MANIDRISLVINMWTDINSQSWNELTSYFHPDASIYWHNTNEMFEVDEFILANSKYPGDWHIDIEKIFEIDDTVISIVKVSLDGESISCHATSVFEILGSRIAKLDEYWGDDGEAPKWRKDMGIGKPFI